MSAGEEQVQRLSFADQCIALTYTGEPYEHGGGTFSTHRESALLDRLHAGGFEIVRVVEAGQLDPGPLARSEPAAGSTLVVVGCPTCEEPMRAAATACRVCGWRREGRPW